MASPNTSSKRAKLRSERTRLVQELARFLDRPMTVLAFVWIALLVIDLTRGLSSSLWLVSTGIWILFVAHFALEFAIAPAKGTYLRKNWLTAVALLLPALRVLRVFRAFRLLRAARAVRSTGIIRILSSLNRGMRALRKTLRARAVGYVTVMTVLVTLAGAAGMYSFENPAALMGEGYSKVVASGEGISTYGEAIWWTAMTMTTMGSDYFPKTVEGRVLGWLLAVYAFAVFGYITATISSYFIGRDREQDSGTREAMSALGHEISLLREEMELLRIVPRASEDEKQAGR